MTTATQDSISKWWDEAEKDSSKWMIIVYDSFDRHDYPVWGKTKKDLNYALKEFNNSEKMSRIMEVYDLSLNKKEQISAHRVWNIPKYQ